MHHFCDPMISDFCDPVFSFEENFSPIVSGTVGIVYSIGGRGNTLLTWPCMLRGNLAQTEIPELYMH